MLPLARRTNDNAAGSKHGVSVTKREGAAGMTSSFTGRTATRTTLQDGKTKRSTCQTSAVRTARTKAVMIKKR